MRQVIIVATWLLVLSSMSMGQAPLPSPSAEDVAKVAEKGLNFLRQAQAPDGSFANGPGKPGVTGLVIAAFLRHGRGPDDPTVARAIKYLESKIQPDGGIHDKVLQNYTTSIAILALSEANRDGRYDEVIKKAVKFLRGMQNDESRDFDPSKPQYGGAGYDAKSRPDVSNTQLFVEALKAAGIGPDDPAMKRALVFLSRCQNLPGEHNDLAFAKAAKPDDVGGFVYNPLPGRQEGGPRGADEGLRSEAGMTYAGLKSFIYAGVDKKDPRVAAAVDWIRRHYGLDENYGKGKSGLYYYYHTFAKAMAVLDEGDFFTDAKGVRHNWKADLLATLKAQQRPDGSWVNDNRQFMEDDPSLCTAFSLLALSHCK